MKKIYYIIIIALLSSCTKWGYVDTGVHDPNQHVNKTMYEYFQTDSYNWKLVKQLVDKAGLKELFNGEDPAHKKIMFLGVVDNTIKAWMLKNGYKSVSVIPTAECKKLLLSYVFDDMHLRDDVPQGNRGKMGTDEQGGVSLTSIGGNKVWLYAEHTGYQISSIIIKSLVSVDLTTGNTAYIATSNILVKNGLVHSLDDGFILGDFK